MRRVLWPLQFLSHRYHLMGFSTRDVAKHAAEAFEQPGECFASDGTDSPATFVDVSPGTTMHVLTTGDMLSRFYKAATCAPCTDDLMSLAVS